MLYKIHCSQVPLIFLVEHAQTCVWVAQKQDALMRATISRVPMLQNVPEIHREIMGFCVHFAVVVLAHSQRITYADVFIVGDVGSALKILGAFFFGKHPYTEDRTYLGDIRHAILQMLLKITETWVWPAGAPK